MLSNVTMNLNVFCTPRELILIHYSSYYLFVTLCLKQRVLIIYTALEVIMFICI